MSPTEIVMVGVVMLVMVLGGYAECPSSWEDEHEEEPYD